MGIVANQPRDLGGILENDSADKAARFINLCDAYGIPLLFLMDVPGSMVGTKVEQAGSSATGRRRDAVARDGPEGHGRGPQLRAGYYVMCGKAYEPDLIVAWPICQDLRDGTEGAVNIIFRKQIEASDDPMPPARR